MKIKTAAEARGATRYLGLHMGPGGSGKSRILGTMPGKVLVIDCEGGSTPTLSGCKNVDIVRCQKWQDFRDAMAFVNEAEHDYDSIAIDDAGSLQHQSILAICKMMVQQEGAPEKKPALYMEKEWWAITANHMKAVASWLGFLSREKGLHAACTVLEQAITDGEHIVQHIPDLQGKVSKTFAPAFDIVVYHQTRELLPEDGVGHGPLQYEVTTRPYGTRNLARDRWGVLEGVEVIDLSKGGGICEWVERIEKLQPSTNEKPTEPETEKPAEKPKKKRGRPPKKKQEEPKAESKPKSEPVPDRPETSETGDPAQCQELAGIIVNAYKAFVAQAPHLQDKANEAIAAALENVGYKKVREAVDANDLGALQAIAEQFSEFEAEMKQPF